MDIDLEAGGLLASHDSIEAKQQMDELAPMADVDVLGNATADDEYADYADDELNLEELVGDRQTKYDLRPQAREPKSMFARTWMDDDKTGLYDPDEEQRKLRQRPKRRNRQLAAFTPWDLNDSDEESELPRERSVKERPRLNVTLSFQSEAGRAAFEEHVRNPPAEPEPSEELFCERRLRRRDSGVGFGHTFAPKATKKRQLPDGFPENLTGHPVARGCWDCLILGMRCPLLDDDRAWPCTTCLDDDHECELVTPPTYKRPCEHCKSRRLGCSYTYSLDHDEPCEECAKTGWRCIAGPAKEAIRERITYDRNWDEDPWQAPKVPKVKKLPSCQGCRERGQICSFSAGDESETCTACDMAGKSCVPELGKPQSSRKRKRQEEKAKQPAIAEKSQNAGQDEKPETACEEIFGKPEKPKKKTQPIIIDESDSSSSDDEVPPPKNGKNRPVFIEESDGSSDSDSDPPPPLPKRTKHNVKQVSDDSSDSDSDSDPLPPPSKKTAQSSSKQKDEKGTLKTFTTKFSHPISFNHQGPKACHFCTDIRFSMFGLGETDVEVVVWNDGRGLDEVSGGHRSRGVEQTRMCVGCTTKRLPIMMCGGHELRQLSDAPTTSLPRSKASALNNLLKAAVDKDRMGKAAEYYSVKRVWSQ